MSEDANSAAAQESRDQERSNLLKAVFWMMMSILSFTAMAIAVRALPSAMGPYQMLFIRSAIGGLIVLAVLSWVARRDGADAWGQLKTTRPWFHLLRNIVHFTGQSLWIIGIQLLPLAMVFAIEFTVPIWGAVLAILFLGEKMNRGRGLALACGFAGVLVVLRPDLGTISQGALVMLACAFFFGATGVITKAMTRTENAFAILFYMTLCQTLLGGVISIFDWQPLVAGHWPWLVLLGLTGLSAHYSLVKAFGYGDASLVMPMDFLRLPFAFFIGWLLYNEAFEVATLAGALIIFAGNYASFRMERKTR